MVKKRGKERSIKEAMRYLQNAKEILKDIPGEDDTYLELKPLPYYMTPR